MENIQSYDDLDSKTRRELENKNISFIIQARFFSLLHQHIVESNSPKFNSIIARTKVGGSRYWKMAYKIVLEYLQQNNMELTLKMINSEFSGRFPTVSQGKPFNAGIMTELIEKQLSNVKKN